MPNRVSIAYDEIRQTVTRLAVKHARVPVSSGDLASGDALSLIDDLGLDSVRFVDLTVDLEDALGIETFPMQEWADRQLELTSHERFRISDLVETCARILAEQNVIAVE